MMTNIKIFIYAIYCYWKNFLANRQGIWILMYHHINDSSRPSDTYISPKRFRQQMHYLKKYCKVLSLREVYDIYSRKKEMKHSRKPQVVITIDDGYLDNYQNAYPILKELGLPATIFLTTGWTWINKEMRRDLNPSTLSWDEINVMLDELITFGAHTKTHPHLPQLDREGQMREIKSSLDSLTPNLSAGIEPSFFSYTYGEYNQVTLEVLRELGVKLAVTVKEGMNTLKNDPLELLRICIDGRSGLVYFIRRLAPDIREVWQCCMPKRINHRNARETA